MCITYLFEWFNNTILSQCGDTDIKESVILEEVIIEQPTHVKHRSTQTNNFKLDKHQIKKIKSNEWELL